MLQRWKVNSYKLKTNKIHCCCETSLTAFISLVLELWYQCTLQNTSGYMPANYSACSWLTTLMDDEWKTNLTSLAVLFHLLSAQHVSDINISIFRSLRLCWWITTSVVSFSVRCVGVFAAADIWWYSFCRLKHYCAKLPSKNSNTQRTENETTDVVIHQHGRRRLKMDILMSETCWAHNKWNKIASDIKLVFHSSKMTNCLLPACAKFQ